VTGIAITTHVEPADPSKPDWMRLSIGLQEGPLGGPLDMVISQTARDGREVVTYSEVLALKESDRKGMVSRQTFQLKPQSTNIKVVVFDRASGRLGSLTLPVGLFGLVRR
jgi:hypothetical protein